MQNQKHKKHIINKRNNFGKTVLHYAVVNTSLLNQSSVTKLINLLIKNGADPDIEDRQNRTALHCAVSEQYLCDKQNIVIQALIDSNCDSLNLYEYKNLNKTQNFTLKQICRTYLVRNCPKLLSKELSNYFSIELTNFLRKKLIL